MTSENKKLIAFTSVAIALVVLSIVFVFIKKGKKEDLEIKQEEEKIKEEQAIKDANLVKPLFNRNGELINSYADLKGKKLIAKSDSNIRSTARINNPTWYAETHTNLLTKATKGAVLGTIIGESKGEEIPAMRWFKIKLEKPVTISPELGTGLQMISQFFSEAKPGTYEYGYVRADVATINQYRK